MLSLIARSLPSSASCGSRVVGSAPSAVVISTHAAGAASRAPARATTHRRGKTQPVMNICILRTLSLDLPRSGCAAVGAAGTVHLNPKGPAVPGAVATTRVARPRSGRCRRKRLGASRALLRAFHAVVVAHLNRLIDGRPPRFQARRQAGAGGVIVGMMKEHDG